MDKLTHQEASQQAVSQGESLDGSAKASPSPAGSPEVPYVEKDEDALYAVGSIVEYMEDGALMFCEVLENTCDKEWLRYKLRIIQQKTRSHFSFVQDAQPEEVFAPTQNRNYCYGGMWHMWPLGTYTRESEWPALRPEGRGEQREPQQDPSTSHPFTGKEAK